MLLNSSTATSLPASKPSSVIAEAPKSGGTLHTPVAASTPFDSAAGTQQTKFDFSSRNNSASSTVPGAFFTGMHEKGVAQRKWSTIVDGSVKV